MTESRLPKHQTTVEYGQGLHLDAGSGRQPTLAVRYPEPQMERWACRCGWKGVWVPVVKHQKKAHDLAWRESLHHLEDNWDAEDLAFLAEQARRAR